MSDEHGAVMATPYGAALGVQIESADAESARLYLPFKDENSNPGQALHGGVAASLINLGGLVVSQESLGAEAERIHTASVQVTYLAAAIGEPVIAEATLLRRGKEICFVNIDVSTEEGKAIAKGIATVRGRFGKDESDDVAARGDDGAADPGLMGPHVHTNVPFIGALGMRVEHMSAGCSRIIMPFQDRNANDAGGVHEGPILALLDTTGAMAAWAETGPGAFKASTVGVQAQMVAAVGAEDLVAYGCVKQRDDEIFWSEVEVATAKDNRTVARGIVLYRIVIPKQG